MGDTSPRQRIEALSYKQRQLANAPAEHAEVIAADLVEGDRMWWGGEIFDVTAVDADEHAVEVWGVRVGWQFPIEFAPFEIVRIVPRGEPR